MNYRVLIVIGLSLISIIGGCSKNTHVQTPSSPKTSNTLDWPKNTKGQPVEKLNIRAGERKDGTIWVHAKGYIHVPLEVAAKAFQEPAVMVNRKAIDKWTVKRNNDPNHLLNLTIHEVIEAMITVEFDVTWIHQPEYDAQGKMKIYRASYEKTAGSEIVKKLTGSILATRYHEEWTAVEISTEVRAVRTSPESLSESVDFIFRSAVANAHGQPLPKE